MYKCFIAPKKFSRTSSYRYIILMQVIAIRGRCALYAEDSYVQIRTVVTIGNKVPVFRHPFLFLLLFEYHDKESVLLFNFGRTAVRHLDFKFLFHIYLSLCPRAVASRGRIDTFPYCLNFNDCNVRRNRLDSLYLFVDYPVLAFLDSLICSGGDKHEADVAPVHLGIYLDLDFLLSESFE